MSVERHNKELREWANRFDDMQKDFFKAIAQRNDNQSLMIQLRDRLVAILGADASEKDKNLCLAVDVVMAGQTGNFQEQDQLSDERFYRRYSQYLWDCHKNGDHQPLNINEFRGYVICGMIKL